MRSAPRPPSGLPLSAFVCVLDRTGAGLDPRLAPRLAEPLADYGGELSSFSRGPVAIAVRHAGGADHAERHGPLCDPESGWVVAVVGGFASLDADGCPGGGAALALNALRRRESDWPAEVAGSFVVVAADPERCRLGIARDHLGALKVYYHLGARWLIAASEPEAILRHEALSDDLDEVAAARFLGFRFSHTERSFFRRIRELPPAHWLRVGATEVSARRYWRLRLRPAGRRRAPAQVGAEFRGHLRRSLTAQVGGDGPRRAALSLSGGLDSTALAALAPPGLRFFSWRFDELPECDERGRIEAVAAHLGKRVHWIGGDGLYPLCGDYVERFVHGNSPHLNAFAALKHRLYAAAREAGCRRVMVGDSADALYAASEYWLRDALAGGRPGSLGSLWRTIRRTATGDPSARRALRRLLPAPSWRRALGRRPQPWLTELARGLLPEESASPILPAGRRPRRYELIAGAKHTELESEEQRLFAQCGVGRSNPFCYWPLFEMAISLPAWWYQQEDRLKVLTREALIGQLPALVLDAGRAGLMGSFFLRGIELSRREIRAKVFSRPRSDWPRYVERSWLEPYLEATDAIRFEHTILWRVISYELWTRRRIGSHGAA